MRYRVEVTKNNTMKLAHQPHIKQTSSWLDECLVWPWRMLDECSSRQLDEC